MVLKTLFSWWKLRIFTEQNFYSNEPLQYPYVAWPSIPGALENIFNPVSWKALTQKLQSLSRANQYFLFQLGCFWGLFLVHKVWPDLGFSSPYKGYAYNLVIWSNYKILLLTKISGTYPKSANHKLPKKRL